MSEAHLPSFQVAAEQIVALSHAFYARGWAFATSGNFSIRLEGGSIAITMSGRHKGDLTTADIMEVDLDGRALRPVGARPSAETLLHCQLYRSQRAVGAVLHLHSTTSTVLSLHKAREGELLLSGYEMLKAFSGVTTHEHTERVPIFEATQDIARLALDLGERLQAHPLAHGYLVAGHGLYTWGADALEARRHAEAFEFLLECELQRMTLK